MIKRFTPLAATALICLTLGILIGFAIHSKQSYRYRTVECPVDSGRGFGHLTGFFREESEWRGGVLKTDSRHEPEWRAFYDRDGKRDGPMIHYWPEGNVESVIHFRHGKVHGQWISFFPNGNIQSMAYYDDGQLVKESHFRDLEPSAAINDFYATIGEANQQWEEAALDAWFQELPEESIPKTAQAQ